MDQGIAGRTLLACMRNGQKESVLYLGKNCNSIKIVHNSLHRI